MDETTKVVMLLMQQATNLLRSVRPTGETTHVFKDTD